jgi:excisionase family DNA binding protein
VARMCGEDDRATLTVEEAALLIGIGRSTAYDAINRGELPHVRIGRRVLVLRQPLLEMLCATETRNPADPPNHDASPNESKTPPSV